MLSPITFRRAGVVRAAPTELQSAGGGSHALMLVSMFVPFLYLDDHPKEDQVAMNLQISLASTVEAFVRERLPRSERVELCHDGHPVVVHRGWMPIADGCKPGEGDRTISLD